MGSLLPGYCVLWASCLLSVELICLSHVFLKCNRLPVTMVKLPFHVVCFGTVDKQRRMGFFTANLRDHLSKLTVPWQANMSDLVSTAKYHRCLPSAQRSESLGHDMHCYILNLWYQDLWNQTSVRSYVKWRRKIRQYVTRLRKSTPKSHCLCVLCLAINERKMFIRTDKQAISFWNDSLWQEIFRRWRHEKTGRDCDIIRTTCTIIRSENLPASAGCMCPWEWNLLLPLEGNMERADTLSWWHDRLKFDTKSVCFHLLMADLDRTQHNLSGWLSQQQHPDTDIPSPQLNFSRVERASHDCSVGFYGTGCERSCHCSFQRPCDPITGKCEDGQCTLGWEGLDCSQRGCPEGYYGLFGEVVCDRQCVCEVDTACHVLSGECEYNSCIEERERLGNCAPQSCHRNFFDPPECSRLCRCYSGMVCHPVTGICPLHNCQGDYLPPTCERHSGKIISTNIFQTLAIFLIGLGLKIAFLFKVRI